MTTFKQCYCARTCCPEEHFVEQVVSHSLHRRARILKRLVEAVAPEFFTVDRELVVVVGGLRTVESVQREIRDYMGDYRNQSRWRGVGKFRVSTQRLRGLVQRHLPSGSPPRNDGFLA